MIIVCGPPKVGKSTSIEKFVGTNPSWHHVVASKLLKQNGKPTESLSAIEAYDNQTLIKKEISARSETNKLILDGHLLVPLREGFYVVGPDVFSDACVSDILFIKPSAVSGLSTSRNVEQGELEISIERSYSRWMAIALRARYHEVCVGRAISTDIISTALYKIQLAVEKNLC